jgi:hypothetical protein
MSEDLNQGANFHAAVRKVLESIGKMYNYTEWSARNLNLNLTSLLVKLFQLNRYNMLSFIYLQIMHYSILIFSSYCKI